MFTQAALENIDGGKGGVKNGSSESSWKAVQVRKGDAGASMVV